MSFIKGRDAIPSSPTGYSSFLMRVKDRFDLNEKSFVIKSL